MAVLQPNKGKVRPVLDFRELNSFVSSHTAESAVCSEKLRKWRRLGTSLSVLDLSKAYLQIHVDQSLWKFQVVVFRGQKFCLTRLGFGLNVAPKIMSAIVTKVLSIDQTVARGTDSFIDDIIVDETVISSDYVSSFLRRYGLETKPTDSLANARVLGLRVFESGGETKWKRDNVLESPTKSMTKRQVFSLCGKLLGHFPIASWLRPACSYLKRRASAETTNWDEVVSPEVINIAMEIWNKVQTSDPVHGLWHVPQGARARVYYDASSMAIGVCVEISGNIVEDACWLRKPDDAVHINLAELEAVLKDVWLVRVSHTYMSAQCSLARRLTFAH